MKEYLANKEVVSILNAAHQIESGDCVWVSGRSALTEDFLNVLLERAGQLKDVTIIIDHPGISPAMNSIKYNGSFKVISGIPEALLQTYKHGDKLEFLCAPGKTVVKIVCRDFGVNTLVAEVLPPDADGLCNIGAFGRSIISIISGMDSIKKQIAIINEELIPVSDEAALRSIPAGNFSVICAEDSPVKASIA